MWQIKQGGVNERDRKQRDVTWRCSSRGIKVVRSHYGRRGTGAFAYTILWQLGLHIRICWGGSLMRWHACMLREFNLVGCSYIVIIDSRKVACAEENFFLHWKRIKFGKSCRFPGGTAPHPCPASSDKHVSQWALHLIFLSSFSLRPYLLVRLHLPLSGLIYLSGMWGDYFVSWNFPDRLFTSLGFTRIIPGNSHKSPPL
jgi:hypothetical protein